MSDGLDGFMRGVFIIELLGVSLVRTFFAGLQIGESKGRRWKESPIYLVGGAPLAVGWVYSMLLYLFSSDRQWMVLGLPDVVRWAGFAASLAVSGFLIWVFATIGTAGAKHIVTFDDMKLATSGPYSWVRHPMYVGFCFLGSTFLLFTDNWAVGGFLVAFVVFVAVFRVPHEEKVLIEHFGDDYRQYMGRTNRFLPFGSRAEPLSRVDESV